MEKEKLSQEVPPSARAGPSSTSGSALSTRHGPNTPNGSFPKPVRLGARAIGWIESEVDAWIREQIAASRGNAK